MQGLNLRGAGPDGGGPRCQTRCDENLRIRRQMSSSKWSRRWLRLFAIPAIRNRTGAFALFIGCFLSDPSFSQDIPVAIAGPLTGEYALFGQQIKNGADQFISDVNASGGLLGHQLKLELADDACDPRRARSVAEKISHSRVAVVIGHYCSSSSGPSSARGE
jgi:ABC-type branched-subunit amino acid transport system substrate-binding protein